MSQNLSKFIKENIIWDPTHPMHFNKIKKTRCMGGTGKRNEQTRRRVKKKMESLLSSLRREKMKMRKSRGTGKSEYS
jgi:hypothetical protein